MASNLVKIKEMQNVTSLIIPKTIAIMEKRKKSLKWCYFQMEEGFMKWIMEKISMWFMFVILEKIIDLVYSKPIKPSAMGF